MKPARELALDAVHAVFSMGFSREFFPRMLEDRNGPGKMLADLVAAIERVIEADRLVQAKAKEPS
jgi:hypothetical protein